MGDKPLPLSIRICQRGMKSNVNEARRKAVDNYLSNVETLLIALEQRDLNPEQVERLARLLMRGERLALERLPKRRKAA